MLNHVISKWDKTITPALWHFAMQPATTIFNTMRSRSHNCQESPWEQFTGEISKLEQNNMHLILYPVFVLDQRLQEGTSHPKYKQWAEQKAYVGHLHHYSWSVPLILYPKTKLVPPQFHVVFDDNLETLQPPNPEIKMDNTLDIFFKTNNYNYEDPSGNEHTYLFSYGGVEIHPDSLSPAIKTYQESINTASTADESSITSVTPEIDSNDTGSILSITDIQILHSRNIFPQNRKHELKAYKHLHIIEMQIHSIPKPPNQKIHELGLSDLH
jgi:hypothetical protein